MGDQIFQIITMIGSLGLFLYGMKTMSESLQRIAGDKLRTILESMTSNMFKRVLVGVFITAIIQSSSATTVMIISFVNAGLINLTQSIGMIMGANIGTTVTAWMISLLGFKIDLGMLAIPFIGVGFPFLFMKSSRMKSTGELIIGFALLFLGLDLMKKSMEGLQQDPSVLEFLASFSDWGMPSVLLFVLVGTLLTVIIQSSSATMAITIIMCNNGWIPFDCAIAMVLGENIGTTITANLAALVANTEAKRAARAHLIFNVIGVLWMLLIFPFFVKFIVYLVEALGGTDPYVASSESRPIALSLFHTMFNIINTLLLIGFTKYIAKFVTRMVKQKVDSKQRLKHIEGGMVSASGLSIMQAQKELNSYAVRTSKMFYFVRDIFDEKDSEKFQKLYDKIYHYENISDTVEVEIGNYLSKTIAEDLGEDNINTIQTMLRVVTDLERIADSNYKMAKIIKYKRESDIHLNDELKERIGEMFTAIDEAFNLMISNMNSKTPITITPALELEEKINNLRSGFRNKYIYKIDTQEMNHASIVICSNIMAEAERMADAVFKVTEHTLRMLHTKPDHDSAAGGD